MAREGGRKRSDDTNETNKAGNESRAFMFADTSKAMTDYEVVTQRTLCQTKQSASIMFITKTENLIEPMSCAQQQLRKQHAA